GGRAASINSSTPATHGSGGTQKRLGNDLLSRGLTPAVPAALEGLTAVFGKGTGVSPPPLSPNAGIIPRPQGCFFRTLNQAFSPRGRRISGWVSYRVRRRRARRLLILRGSAGGT